MQNRAVFDSLYAAMSDDHYEKVCHLLAQQPDLDEEQIARLSALPLSEEVHEVFASYNKPQNKGKERATPDALLRAIREEKIDLIKKLLQEVNPNEIAAEGPDRGRSALLVAAELGNEEIVNLLLEQGASPNQLDVDFSSPLLMAVKAGHYKLVENLIIAGADPRIANLENESPRNIATANKRFDIANLVAISSKGQSTALLVADAMGFGRKPGMCHGLGHMAKQSILADDIMTSNHRLVSIHKMWVEVELEAMAELGYLATGKTYTKSQGKKIYALTKKKLQKKLGNVFDIKENALHEVEKKEFFLQREYDEAVGQAIQDKTDIFAYYQGALIYQDSTDKKFAHLYEKNSGRSYAQLDERATALISPIKLTEDKDSSPVAVDSFTGAYETWEELSDYCRYLRKAMDKQSFTGNIAFVLTSMTHTITIGYNPKQKTWYFFDSNCPPILKIKSDKLVAQKINQSFRAPVIISSTVHVKTIDAPKMQKCMDNLNHQAGWINLHRVTSRKANLRNYFGDWIGFTWEDIASRHGDPVKVKEIHRQQNFFLRYWKSIAYFGITLLGVGVIIPIAVNLFRDHQSVKEAEKNQIASRLARGQQSKIKVKRSQTYSTVRGRMEEQPASSRPVTTFQVQLPEGNVLPSSTPASSSHEGADKKRDVQHTPPSPNHFIKK